MRARLELPDCACMESSYDGNIFVHGALGPSLRGDADDERDERARGKDHECHVLQRLPVSQTKIKKPRDFTASANYLTPKTSRRVATLSADVARPSLELWAFVYCGAIVPPSSLLTMHVHAALRPA